MYKALRTTAIALVSCGLAAGAGAQQVEEGEVGELVINGEIEMTVEAPAPDHLEALDTIYSGWVFRSEETKALQMDDFDNPAFLFVDQAQADWNAEIGAEGESCASCHGDPDESMRGVRATYPKWNEEAEEVRTIQMQVNSCLQDRMGTEPWEYAGTRMTSMVALISSVSRGMTVDVATDGPARETWERGKEIYYTRYGQLELACANCHEDNYGNMIRADHLSQGHTNGFPVYRLKNTRLNATHSRFRGCVRDTRAETFEVGSPEFVALELYVASRGNGLSVEAPSVRN